MISRKRIPGLFVIGLCLCALSAGGETVGAMADDGNGTLYPPALESRVADKASMSWVEAYVAEHGGGGGGGGAGVGGAALLCTSNTAMVANGNVYAAFGLDTSQGPVTLYLAPQTNFQTVVVRRFGSLYEATVIGAKTNSLAYDGDTLVMDYWPPQTNWYWRAQ